MPMFLCPLFSGSKGNSTFVASDDTAILVDAGVARANIDRALGDINASLDIIKGILVTHEHVDHIRAVGMLSRKNDIPIYANEDTWKAMLTMNSLGSIPFKNRVRFDGDFYIGSLAISPIKVSHDAADPVGYSIFNENKKAVVISDTGYLSKTVLNRMLGADACLMESNHDVHMVENGPYPVRLKNRILSKKGHLSNHDAAQALMQIINSGCKNFSLTHLSQDNNTPEAAYDSASAAALTLGAVAGKDVNIYVAPQFGPGDAIII
ncbi:MAG: MBL fold metallo-hydrolase [Clostridiales bacterium]|nr:MBL fold metallo-hydrolase [Clostridiales bacterium]